MKTLTTLENLCFRCGAILMIAGAAAYIIHPTISLFVYGIGTLMFCLMQVRTEYLGRDITLIRLRRQQLLACCCFVLALVMMSMQLHEWGPCRRREWIVALTVGCILELYTSIRIPQELKE
ncbi:MAG: hypothetical protein J1F27_06150 [Prevotellaceae bacterium]|nr:hypothetical protein [Prevotellaceae bacterium]